MNIESYTNSIKNENVKEYMVEAINSYNSGSFRASITYTWLAIFMDINQKIEQLSILGEQEAINIIQKIEKIRKDNNIQEMLSFEKDILNTAKENFSLFDDITLIDLKRIQEDRNRSVHPLLSYEGVLYKPTAEQARTHIINAYSKLLNEPNVYGKSVINRLFELIYSTIFPMDYTKAKIVLDSSYLKSPKESLLRNFTISLLKQYVKETLDFHKRISINNTLKYLFENNRGKIENVIADKLSSIITFTNNDELMKLFDLILIDVSFYSLFDDAHKILINNFIDKFPSGKLEMLADLTMIPDISKYVELRINKTETNELYEYVEIPFGTKKPIRKLIVARYIASETFEQANAFASVIVAIISEMEKDEIINLILGIASNGQVSSSFQVGKVLRAIRHTKEFSDAEFISILTENNLEHLLQVP